MFSLHNANYIIHFYRIHPVCLISLILILLKINRNDGDQDITINFLIFPTFQIK